MSCIARKGKTPVSMSDTATTARRSKARALSGTTERRMRSVRSRSEREEKSVARESVVMVNHLDALCFFSL
jgi:hypothetical protein